MFEQKKRWFAFAALALAWLAFSFLSFAPLRIGTDSVRLFIMALPAANGGAYGVDQFPPFYPHLLCGLMKMGICNNVVLIGLNFLALGVGLLLVYGINRHCGLSWIENYLVVAAILLNWNIAKHTMLPQTDIMLLPFFWGTIMAVLRYRDALGIARKIMWMAVAVALAGLSVSVRIAAVAVFGLIAVALTGITEKNIRAILSRKTFWIVAFSLASALAVGVMLAIRYTDFAASGGYFQMFCDFMSHGWGPVVSMFFDHLFDLAQLLINAPARVIPVAVRMPFLSVAAVALVAMHVFLMKKGLLDWYLFIIAFGYGLEIFLWPCLDPRFFLPILPILLIVVVRTLHGLFRRRRILLWGCVALYAVLGFVSWGKFVYEWSRGDEFYRHTALPRLSRAYQNALNDVSEVPQDERSISLFILKKFDLRYAQKDLKLGDYMSFTAPWLAE